MIEFPQGIVPGSLELAYMGDTVYDLYIREQLVRQGGKVRALHRRAVSQVRASAQSEAFCRIEAELTQEEADVARRARNAHQNPPKSADPADYHRATAFEAVLGYLYLTGRMERAWDLLGMAVRLSEETEDV